MKTGERGEPSPGGSWPRDPFPFSPGGRRWRAAPDEGAPCPVRLASCSARWKAHSAPSSVSASPIHLPPPGGKGSAREIPARAYAPRLVRGWRNAARRELVSVRIHCARMRRGRIKPLSAHAVALRLRRSSSGPRPSTCRGGTGLKDAGGEPEHDAAIAAHPSSVDTSITRWLLI